jgi:Amt family ammonium transporter
MLAGLVAITAPCAFVSPNSAVVIGVLAGVVVCMGVLFNERVAKIDHPCGAISVHGFCGWLGAVCVGSFADGTYGSGWNGVGAATYLGHAGQGVTGFVAWRYTPVLVSVGRRHAVRAVGVRGDLCGVFRGEQG